MTSDVEIAQQFTPCLIIEISESLGVKQDDLLPYGKDIAKIDVKRYLSQLRKKDD